MARKSKRFRVEIIGTEGDEVYIDGVKYKWDEQKSYTRKLFFLPRVDIILKLERYRERDGEQCAKENFLWKTMDEKDRKFFIPVLQYGEDFGCPYVIQPRFRNMRFPKDYKESVRHVNAWKNVIQKLGNKYQIADLDDWGGNWTIHKGIPLIYDYGLNASSKRINYK